ncbi:MAG: sporulation protein YqfD [Eubacteriales bacterium]|jgi:similar to stage IV sporulation protein|nr:sporulation protein YqfD [Eubacteriales bacterium]
MRLTGITNFLSGYYILRAPNGTAFTNLLLAQGIASWNPKLRDGSITLCMLRSEYKRLKLPCETDVVTVREVGLPQLIERYRRRPGILVGALLFAVILYLSSQIIWSVEVKGAQRLSEEDIIDELAGLGCGVGSFIPFIDFYVLCNDYLTQTGDVSWISVNIRGTVAYVELRERIMPEITEKSDNPANIVAASDGIVQHVEVYSGIAAVKAGDAVRKGQLLISGIMDSISVGFRATRAQGRVIAQTAVMLEVSVPFETTEKVYTGRSGIQNTIKVFGKSINLFLKSRNLYEKCDTIETTDNIMLFDVIKLPLALRTVTYKEYTDEVRVMSETEAGALAALQLSEDYARRFASSEILSMSTESVTDSGAYRIICEVSCTEDIGETREFGFAGTNGSN